jgi:hypothetical protein
MEANCWLSVRRAPLQGSVRMRTAIVSGSLFALGLLVIDSIYMGQDFVRTRRAEEELRLARNTLENRVRERKDEAIKSGVAFRAREQRRARISPGVDSTSYSSKTRAHALHVRTAIYPRVAKDTGRHP